MKNTRQNKKKKNQGFSLITVIVAVSFVGILGMLVLYISLANLQMKVTDLKGKDSFYTAEQALEEIRTGLQQDVGDAMSEAFIHVMENYNIDVGEGLVSQEDERQKLFQYRFVNDMKNRLRGSDENHYDIEYLKGYLDLETYDAGSSTEETLIVTNPSGKDPLMIQDNYGVLLKNIKVIHVDEKGRASIIVTDIRLGIPQPDFPNASTLPDLMNFSLIADEGIVCKSVKDNPAVISGSTYAGRMDSDDQQTYHMGTTNAKERASIWLKAGAGLQINAGEKFVSEGDILVNDNGKFEFTSGRELWAQGISASSMAEVDLTGTIYLSDDLTVESGKNSRIKVSGNYYGYGAADSAKESLNYRAEDSEADSGQNRLYSGASNADLSSSIIINGKNTTMDLSGTHRLMLAGRSYIASSSISVVEDKSNADVKTGESLAVKGTQMVYLVPPELLGTAEDKETLNNPMTYQAYLDYLNAGGYTDMPVKSSAKVTAWSGKTLADITGYNEGKEQVQTVFYNDNSAGGGFVYFYLNFASDQKASSFMDQYYSNNETVRKNLDQYLSFYFGNESGIKVNDPKTYTRYVTNGNILTYDGGTRKGKVTAATSAITSEEMKKEQIGLQNTWYALNRKMLTGVNLLNTKVKEEKAGENITHDESDPSRSVFDNIVDERELASLVEDSTKKREFSNNGKKALIYHNSGTEIKTYAEAGGTGIAVAGDNKTLYIDESCGYSLIVCTGDVELAANTEFHGIIVAKGKITLNSGSKLISSSQDASAVFQAVDDGGKKLKDVFWDGAEYAPGGTDTDDTENGSAKDIYDLSDCVTYENWKKQ